MLRRVLLTVLIVALALTFVLPVAAQEEETDSEFNITLLEDGVEVETAFDETISAQIFGFNATEGDAVTLSATAAEGVTLDTYIILLGADGSVVGYNDDTEAGNFNSMLEVSIPADGSYFLLVTSLNGLRSAFVEEGSDPLAYTVVGTGFNTPEGMEAENLSMGGAIVEANGEVEGSLSNETPVAFYVFPAEAGQVANIAMSSDAFDTVLYVFNPDGGRIAVNDDSDGTNSAVEGVTLEADGYYVVVATVFAFNLGDVFTEDANAFTLTIETE